MQFCSRIASGRNFSGLRFFFVTLWYVSLQSLGGYRSGFFWFTLALRMWPLEDSRSWLCPGLCETKQTQSPKVSYWQMTSKAWLPSLTSLRFCLVIHYKLVSSFQEDVFGQMLTRNFTPKDLCTKMLLGKLSIVHKNEV